MLPIVSQEDTPLPGPRAGVGPLRDSFGRVITYLRVSVTDRCDLRCVYCMPEVGNPVSPRAEVLTVEEIVRAVSVFRRLGVTTVRITGGEPLLRRGLVEIVAGVRALGIEDIALSTNATRLSEVGPALRAAGVRRINISLDTLRPERLQDVSRRGDHARILAGIEVAAVLGFEERKLNTVVMRGINDDELGELVDFAWARGFTPRFIELMPIGEGAALYPRHKFSTEEIIERLGARVARGPRERRAARGPARYLSSATQPEQQVGFISALTDNFCDGCNRARMSAKGELRPCLASPRGVSLRDLMRAGESDDTLEAALRGALDGKEATHHFLDDTRTDHHRVTMSGTGG